MGPEEKARLEIDRKLEHAGYVVQDMKEFNPTVSLGVAVREYPTNAGEADYVLFIDRKPVGVIEAKARTKEKNY
jgi:type I restriction enzyme R subunit